MYSTCQRCWNNKVNWTVDQAEFHVGKLKHWKVQLCERCAGVVEQALLAVLQHHTTVGEARQEPETKNKE